MCNASPAFTSSPCGSQAEYGPESKFHSLLGRAVGKQGEGKREGKAKRLRLPQWGGMRRSRCHARQARAKSVMESDDSSDEIILTHARMAVLQHENAPSSFRANY